MHVPVPDLWRALRLLPATFLASLVAVTQTMACSTVAFPVREHPLLAYNFDFADTDAGYLTVNARDIWRQSVMEGTPARWLARFGSITVNQIGPGMPTAGMNSEGLVVTLMWNEDAVFGGEPDTPVLSELEFIQYLLDTAGSVEEALTALDKIRIQGLVPIHYFLFDRTGRAATLTPTENGLLVNVDDTLPVPALTNTGYATALDHLSRYSGFGGEEPVPARQQRGDGNSLDRFTMAAAATRTAPDRIRPEDAFDVLDRLSNAETRWQLVFDPERRQMRLRLAGSAEVFLLDLLQQDFTCTLPPRAADLRQLTPDQRLEELPPLDPETLAVSLAEVFSSMRQTAHLGRQEVVAGIAAGLLASASCAPE